MQASIQLLKRAQRTSTKSGSLVSSSSQLTPMEECVQHYTNLFNRELPLDESHANPTMGQPPISIHHGQSSPSSKVDSGTQLPPITETSLLESGFLDNFTTDKIKVQLQRMSTTSSSGSDGITVIMLRHLLDTSFTEHLHQLFLACLRQGQTPKRWNEATIFPLCKDQSKPYTATNSRPISILAFFAKSLKPFCSH